MDKETEKPVVEDTPASEPPPMATLDDFKPRTIPVEIDIGGEPKLMELRGLTYYQFNKVMVDITDPAPVEGGIDPKTKRVWYNYNDPGYLARRTAVEMERQFVRLARSIVKPAIPGETEQERVEWIRDNFDANPVRQLNALIAAIAMRGEAKIQNLADSFHGDG